MGASSHSASSQSAAMSSPPSSGMYLGIIPPQLLAQPVGQAIALYFRSSRPFAQLDDHRIIDHPDGERRGHRSSANAEQLTPAHRDQPAHSGRSAARFTCMRLLLDGRKYRTRLGGRFGAATEGCLGAAHTIAAGDLVPAAPADRSTGHRRRRTTQAFTAGGRTCPMGISALLASAGG